MDSKSDTLKKLEALYNQARTPAERAILLGTMRIVSPEEHARLEEVLQREQLRNMPMEEILPTLAQQRGVSIEETRRAVADLIFDHMLDRSKLPLTGVSTPALSETEPQPPAETHSPAPAAPVAPKIAPPPPTPPRLAPRPAASVPKVQILDTEPREEAPPPPPPPAAPPEETTETAPAAPTTFILPRGISAE